MFTDESRFSLGPDDKRIRIRRKQGACNQPQNITEHHAFRDGSILVLTGISLGYRTDQHIFKRGSVTALRYRDEVLEPTVRLYAAAVGPNFVLMDDNAHPLRADIVNVYLESEGIADIACQHICPNLITLEIFGMFSAVLYLHVFHLQPLLLSWKLLYKKNGDCLILRRLTTQLKAWSEDVNFAYR
ncbi:transposable element Tcb1 transposase [Trichonephila clavipes]|nr:transposable element Tcb1 transposase [Trichonephila clavipes]